MADKLETDYSEVDIPGLEPELEDPVMSAPTPTELADQGDCLDMINQLMALFF